MILPLIFASLIATSDLPEDAMKKVQAHLVIADYSSGAQEAMMALQQHPDSKLLWQAYFRTLGKGGEDQSLMKAWNSYIAKFPEEKVNPEILEILAWSVIDKGVASSTPIVRLTGILGAFFSQDAKGIAILQKAMSDQHAFVRGAALKLSSRLHDTALQDEVLRLLRNEKAWKVRLEAISAVGKMRLAEAEPYLMKMIARDDLHIEEKTAAIGALVAISDAVDRSHVIELAGSNRAGLRLLGCELIAHYDQTEDIDLLFPLLKDHHADVRAKVYETIGRLRLQTFNGHSVTDLALAGTSDPDPIVAVNAAWALTLNDPTRGQSIFAGLLRHSSEPVRHLAAGALAATGKYGMPLMNEAFKDQTDAYIRMNLALGLIGQRVEVEKACSCLFQGLSGQKEKWAWREEGHFRILEPSKVKHDETIPNYPEAVNQLTRLEVLQILAVVHYPEAQQAIKNFLKESHWGVTGIASALLLTEGDEDAIELVQGLLKDPDHKVRVQAALILALWGRGEDAVQLLQNAYAGADRDLKGQILEGIGRVGSPASLPFLAERLQEPFQSLRIIAAAALLECLYH